MAIQHINLGAGPDDKTGTPARVAGQIINQNFDYLDGKISNKNQVVTYGTYVLVGQVLTIHAGWVWMINGQEFTNPVDVEINYPYAATGKQRLDRVNFNTSNTFSRIAGPESVSNPIVTPSPADTIEFGINLVTDSAVGNPSAPIIGDDYVMKNESQDFIVSYGSTLVVDQINLIDNRFSVSVTGSITDVKSVQVSGEFIRPGKPHFFKNRTAHNVKIWHNSGTGNIKYFFANGLDLIVKPNEVIEFCLNANDSSANKFEYVGIDLSSKADLVSGKVPVSQSAPLKTVGGQSVFGTGDIDVDATKRIAKWWALGAASGMSQQGALLDYPLILTGTKVSQTTITYTNLITSIARLVYRSAATAGASCGVATGSGSVRPFSTKSGIDLKLKFDTSDLTPVSTSRIAAGISALTVDMGNINPSSMVSTILVGNDTGDSNLFLMHNDSSGTCTKIDLGSNFPHNTINCIYELLIKTEPDTTIYTVIINRYDNTSPSKNPIFSYTTILNTNVPNTQLSWFVSRNNGATASSVEVGVSYVENKYFY